MNYYDPGVAKRAERKFMMDHGPGSSRRKRLSVVLRPAESGDAAAVARLAEELGYPSSETGMVGRLRCLARHPDLHGVFVAEGLSGGVVAWMHVFICHHVESDPFAEIGGLVVEEESRGIGLGEALVQRAERWARERGMTHLRVRSNVIRAGAHRFYERLGFERIKEQAIFEKHL